MKKFSLLKNVETITSDNTLPVPTKSNQQGGEVGSELEKAALAKYGDKSDTETMRILAGSHRIAFIQGAQWQREQDQWISVETSLPEIDALVLVYDNDIYGFVQKVFVAKMNINEMWHVGLMKQQLDSVTHWMPLPEPPKI